MLKRHVSVEHDELIFDYQAKGGRRRVQAIADPAVREVVAELKRRAAVIWDVAPDLVDWKDETAEKAIETELKGKRAKTTIAVDGRP